MTSSSHATRKRCLVTGGAGFIGSNLALAFQKLGHDVTVVDDFSTGRRRNLRGFAGTILEGDIAEPGDLAGPYDVVFHQAAVAAPREGDDAAVWHSNIDGFRRMAELARAWGARLIYASTADVYGNGPVPQREDQTTAPLSTYAQSKLLVDRLAERARRDQPIVGLRYFDVYGPREGGKGAAASLVYHLARSIEASGRAELAHDGDVCRDFVYVLDCVRANLRAMTAPPGIYNVGTGVAIRLADLVQLVGNALDRPVETEYQTGLDAARAHTQASTAQSRVALGFAATYALERAIPEYVAWLRRSGELDACDDTDIGVPMPVVAQIASASQSSPP